MRRASKPRQPSLPVGHLSHHAVPSVECPPAMETTEKLCLPVPRVLAMKDVLKLGENIPCLDKASVAIGCTYTSLTTLQHTIDRLTEHIQNPITKGSSLRASAAALATLAKAMFEGTKNLKQSDLIKSTCEVAKNSPKNIPFPAGVPVKLSQACPASSRQ